MYDKSYLQLVKEGVIKDVDEINLFIDYWNNHPTLPHTMSLQQYLGLSPSLYNLYLQDAYIFFYTISTIK